MKFGWKFISRLIVSNPKRQEEEENMRTSLQYLNECPADQFSFLLGSVFDHSPWVATAVADQRPFNSKTDLLSSMCAVVKNLAEEQKLALIRDHHELCKIHGLTAEAIRENEEAGLEDLDEEETALWNDVSHAYWLKFGFPFVICTSKHNKSEMFENMKSRLNNSRDIEISNALKQIYQIAQTRLERVVVE